MSRWDYLVQAAFSLDEKAAPTREELETWLASVCEVFGSEVDPVTDFEAYAVRRLVFSLRQTVERLDRC